MNQGLSHLAALGPALPEGILALGICLVLAFDLWPAVRRSGRAAWLGALACVAALAAAWPQPAGAIEGMLAFDGIAAVARPALLLLTALVLVAGCGERRAKDDQGAWATCVLGVGLGALLTASAQHLLVLWLGLELMSLSSYSLASWRARDRRAAEAGMKYVLFGGAASGVMLFGISHLYGLTGHLDFTGIGSLLATQSPLALAAPVLLALAGAAYKLSVVPFHFYAPDVYQGAPPLSVAAVSAAPKLAAGAVLLRALPELLPIGLVPQPSYAAGFAIAAMLSLAVAAFTALAQRDAKRILAFSGIGHGGTVLLALANLPLGIAKGAALFYLLAYAAANVGAFVCLSVLERDRGGSGLDRLPGAMRRRPWVTAALCLFVFSLAGVPPLAGFTAKWAVLQLALAGGPFLVAGSLALLAATALFAWSYLLIVRAAVLAPVAAADPCPSTRVAAPTAFVLLCCAAATVVLGLWLDGIPAIAAIASR